MKNCKSNSECEDWVSSCDPVYVGVEPKYNDIFLPYMVLLLNVRPGDPGSAFVPSDGPMTRSLAAAVTPKNASSLRRLKACSLCIFGFSVKQFNRKMFPEDAVIGVLKNMIYDFVEDLNHCWTDGKQREFVRQVQPLSYESPIAEDLEGKLGSLNIHDALNTTP